MEFKLEVTETKAEETSNEKLKPTKREPRDGHASLSAACRRYWQFDFEKTWRSCQAIWRCKMAALPSIMTQYPVRCTTYMILGTFHWTWV